MEEDKKAVTAATVTADENRRITEATTVLTSEELKELDDSAIALKLFYLINNGVNKNVNDFQFIAGCLHGFAVQLISQEKRD